MTEAVDHAPPRRLADLPLAEREAREVEIQREIGDGLTSRHLAICAEQHALAAVNFARLLHFGRASGKEG